MHSDKQILQVYKAVKKGNTNRQLVLQLRSIVNISQAQKEVLGYMRNLEEAQRQIETYRPSRQRWGYEAREMRRDATRIYTYLRGKLRDADNIMQLAKGYPPIVADANRLKQVSQNALKALGTFLRALTALTKNDYTRKIGADMKVAVNGLLKALYSFMNMIEAVNYTIPATLMNRRRI